MNVIALNEQSRSGAEPATPIEEAGSAQRCVLLDTYDQVLRLIACDGDLAACLEAIAIAVKDLHRGADCLIVAFESDGRHVVSSAATSTPLEEVLSVLTSLDGADNVQAVDEVLCGRGLVVGGRHRIVNHAGQTLGSLIVTESEGESRAPLDPKALDSLKLLTGYAIDSTRRTQALLSANERFAALAKNIPGVVYQRVVRPNGDIRYSYISEAARDLFGVSPEEILSDSQALFDCHGPDYYSTFHGRLLEASRRMQLWDVEATIITRDGTRKFTHAIARPHREADGSVVWNGVILDQTRIKEAEIEAAAASTRTRDAIIESIPQAFALFDLG